MDILLLFLLALPIITFVVYTKKKHHLSPPGPHGFPLIGNIYQFSSSVPHIYLAQLAQKYGPVVMIRLGSRPTLAVNSAKMAQEVLKTRDQSFCSRPALLSQQRLSYNGHNMAFSPYNEHWREMRKLCTLHVLSPRRAQSFRPIREEEVSQVIQRVSQLAKRSENANISEIAASLSNSIISRIAFGKRYGEDWFGRDELNEFLLGIQAMFACFFVSDYFPLFGWIDKFTGNNEKLDKCFNDLDAFYQKLIDEHLHPDRSKLAQHEDIIDILLQLRDDKSSPFELTMDRIKGVLLDMFIGGTSANTSAIIWVMTALMHNPKCMKKVQEEIRNLVGEKGKVDEDDLPNFAYFKAVVMETMRLYPPAPLLLPRETLEDCVITEGNHTYKVESKTLVYINAWAIGRDPECWENPNEFLPERFLSGKNRGVDIRGQDFELIPFGGGRRGCPGITVAMASLHLVLANLLYSFDWELPEGMKEGDINTDTQSGLAVQRKNELCLRPKIYAFSSLD